ncbi:PTS sugar transporter subunit IIA [Desulfonatronum thiodismutans]|uniref:PTS sugar transporter subunit IIA n=1 Tax=Desulfonatronum thiodismutans TaxID=159290 RepID=UPI0004ABD30B|nr:PTS sugar transporter subunit IIA [Desulfonatronum thiodismutans]
MVLRDFLSKDLLLPELQARNKAEVLAELVAVLAQKEPSLDAEAAFRVLKDRESLGSTGIGEGVAIPHGKLEGLERIVLVVGRSAEGVDFDALDRKPCHIFFMVLAPEQVAGMHLRILASITRLLKDEAFRHAFLTAQDKELFWDALSSA